MYYLGTVSGASGGAYNWSGGASGIANFTIPKYANALYFEPGVSGIRFALSHATGYTAFLSTGAGINAAQLGGPTGVQGPFYKPPGLDTSVGFYFSNSTQYSVRVWAAVIGK